MSLVLQYTLPGVPCVYYGDENGMEGHIDPFCRRCFDWDSLNQDLISFYKSLGEIRKNNREIFTDGAFKEIICEDGLLVYKRCKNNKEIYVYTNNSSKVYKLEIDKIKELISNQTYANVMEIQPNSYGIFVKEKA